MPPTNQPTNANSQLPPAGSNLPAPLDGGSAGGFNPAQPNAGLPVAEDEELLSEEWAVQVEQLFNTYRDDPYKLASVLAELKKQYIGQRFGRSFGDRQEGS